MRRPKERGWVGRQIDQRGPGCGPKDQPQSNPWFKWPAVGSLRNRQRPMACGLRKGFAFVGDAFGERSRAGNGRGSSCSGSGDEMWEWMLCTCWCAGEAVVMREASIFALGAERQRGTRIDSQKASSTRVARTAKGRPGSVQVSSV